MQPNRSSSHSEEDFKAKKVALHDDAHGGGGHGGTEMGWLVSYADMMTLLFGLFVILFSLATDKSKSPTNVDEVMKEVSKKYFRSGDNPEKKQEAPKAPPEAKLEPVKLEPPPAPTEEVALPTKKVKLLPAVQLETLLEQAKKNQEEVVTLQQSIEEMKKEKLVLLAKIKNTERKPTVTASEQKTKTENVNPKLESVSKELNEVKNENQQLRDELQKEKNKNPLQNYMMIMISWETEKHDLDLKITTPSGKTFDFKKRSINREPGSFELDSRYGPGVEMWKAENFTPGRYICKVSLYNKNGNDKNPKFQLNVMTNLQNFKSKVLEIQPGQTQMDLVIQVDKEGVVQLQN